MVVPRSALALGVISYPSRPWDSHFQASSLPKARLSTVTSSLTIKAE